MSGILYGVGIGPGDPDLITLKALKLLQSVPVIAYPAPAVGNSLARQIAAPHIPEGRREIIIRISMAPKDANDRSAYDRAAVEIGAVLRDGQDVAVICEGDPFFYGSFMYLFNRLSGEFEVQVIPGVSSLTACSGATLMPLASHTEVLCVLPAPLPEDELRARLAQTDAAAIIKLGRHANKICTILKDMDLLAGAKYVAHATMPNQTVGNLADIDPADVPYFSMILVRKNEVTG
jgi:precorrin-2/cobalt-factor-2 C20-methyltransferase